MRIARKLRVSPHLHELKRHTFGGGSSVHLPDSSVHLQKDSVHLIPSSEHLRANSIHLVPSYDHLEWIFSTYVDMSGHIWEYSYFILILISRLPPTPSPPQSKSNNPKREEGPNPLQSGALYPRPTKNSTSKKKKLATQCVAN